MPEPFPATRWTLLGRAREPGDRGALAREEFAEMYHRPILEYLLVIVREPDLAADLAQAFFSARLISEAGIFAHADQRHGTFRAFLKTALRNYVTDHYRSYGRKDALQTHPDQREEGGWDHLEFSRFRSAESAFHHAWVEATLVEALATVREICRKKGQLLHLTLFEARYLSSQTPAPSWEDLGAPHGLDQKTARTRADTVARHFRFVLRRMLRRQLLLTDGPENTRAQLNESAIDREIEALLSPIQE